MDKLDDIELVPSFGAGLCTMCGVGMLGCTGRGGARLQLKCLGGRVRVICFGSGPLARAVRS